MSGLGYVETLKSFFLLDFRYTSKTNSISMRKNAIHEVSDQRHPHTTTTPSAPSKLFHHLFEHLLSADLDVLSWGRSVVCGLVDWCLVDDLAGLDGRPLVSVDSVSMSTFFNSSLDKY